MKKTKNGYLYITRHPHYGFTWHYRSKNDDYFKFHYVGFGIREAKKHFITFIKKEGLNV